MTHSLEPHQLGLNNTKELCAGGGLHVFDEKAAGLHQQATQQGSLAQDLRFSIRLVLA
jgi:hypothetical protein